LVWIYFGTGARIMSNYTKLMQQAAAGIGGGFYPYTVDYSARFNDDDSAYLSRTPSAGNSKTFTISYWMKVASPTPVDFMLAARNSSGGAFFSIKYQTNGALQLNDSQNSDALNLISNALHRDVSSWYHIVVAMDTTQATSSDRCKIYVNGVQITSFSTSSYPAQNANMIWNTAVGHYINCTVDGSGNPTSLWDGYYSQVSHVDGQALDPTSFGKFKNGVWVPKRPSVTYGTNGFYLDFADSSNLGNDVSGNNNDFTSSGLTSSDQMIDTSTNNFCTLNPLDGVATAEGNLQQPARSSSWATCQSTMAFPKTGKWYWEAGVFGSGTSDVGSIGISADPASSYVGSTTNGYGYVGANGNIYVSGAATAYGATYGANDIIGILFDADNGDLTFYKNGTSQGVAESGLDTSIDYRPAVSQYNAYVTNVNFGQNGTFNGAVTAGGNSDANGIGDFKYTVPTDALALCTANLAEPTIGPNIDENSSGTTSDENFAPVLYTGNGTAIGSGGKTISDLVFQPDFVWIKNRDAADNHMMFDAVRAATKYLSSDTTTAETTDTESLTSFASTGFTLGNNVAVNTNAEDYVAWNWKGNGSGVSNTDGTITSTVSANQDAGFSIVTYTGNGTADSTIGHGLNAKPKLILVKNISSATDWMVYSEDCTKDYYLVLNTTDAQVSASNFWGGTGPTTSTFQVGAPPPAGYMTKGSTSYMSIGGSGTQASPYSGNSTNHAHSTQGVANFAVAGGAGVLYWKVTVSSEASYDFARLYVDGSLKVNISGSTSRTSSQAVNSGSSVQFRYYKDGSVSSGADTGYLNYLYLVPSSSGKGANDNGDNYVAYCFAEVESFSSFGKFTGNGSADGPFVYTGFRPAFIMVKRTDASSDWVLWDEKRDPYNYMGRELQPDKSDAELSLSEDLDFLSNGFKLRGSGTNFNGSGGTYIYMAFAENPFKYANAR